MEKRNHVISFRGKPELMEKIDKLVEALGVSKAELLELALEPLVKTNLEGTLQNEYLIISAAVYEFLIETASEKYSLTFQKKYLHEFLFEANNAFRFKKPTPFIELVKLRIEGKITYNVFKMEIEELIGNPGDDSWTPEVQS